MTYDEQRYEIVKKFLHDISEFCDGCQIIISGTDPDGNTFMVEDGVGNWHARMYAVQLFMDEHSGSNSLTVNYIDNEEGEEEE